MKQLLKPMLFSFIVCLIVFQPNEAVCIDLNYPEIGKAIPDFTLDSISGYTSSQITRTDMRGKYYILDFWNSGCALCIASFPKVNKLQQKYKGRLQMFLVGRPDDVIEKLYERLRLKYNLNLAVGYSGKLTNAFCPAGFPHLIWVDGSGIIKAITASEDLNEKNIDDFLNNRTFAFRDYSYKGLKERRTAFDWREPFLVNGNGDVDTNFVYRSLISKWHKEMPAFSPGAITDIPDGHYIPSGYQILRINLEQLYNLAYFGEFYPNDNSIHYYPIYELKDSSSYKENFSKEDRFYCYSLILPREKYSRENIMKFLRKDLECYFPYKAQVERRAMPCYLLKIVEERKTKNLQKKNSKDFVSNYMEREYNNYSTSRLAKSLAYATTGKLRVFDETNIKDPINIKIHALMTDIEEVKIELRKYGLDLIPSTRLMEVLVITEAESGKAQVN